MNPESIQRDIEELEADGWQPDSLPRAVEKQFRFDSYSDTLNFLVEMGAVAEEVGSLPAIRIDDGTAVHLRIGRPPAPALTDDEIALARALPSA